MAFLEFAINSCLINFYELTSSYGFSLILLSLAVSVCLAPFYYLTGILENKERIIKQRLEPFIQKINTIKNAQIRHFQLKKLYNSFSYYPFYSLRSLAGLFIQIPMLFAAYGVLTKNPLDGEKFLFINDLGKADFLLFGINLLPIIMTAINIASVFLSAKAGSAERRQGVFIAMIFFILLYSQNSALLIYWTFNQIFSFIRYVFVFKTINLAMPKISLATLRNLVFPKPKLINFILAFSGAAFPAILIYRENAIYFIGTDLQVYIAVLFISSIALTLLFKSWIAVSLIISFMFFPTIKEIAYIADNGYLSRILCFFVILYFMYFFIKLKPALIIFFISASIYCSFFIDLDKQPVFNNKVEMRKIPQDLADLEIKDSSSIYLFMHDAFPHKDYSDYFNFPNYDDFITTLEKNSFNIYNVYSLADRTLPTMYSLFQMSTNSFVKTKNGVNTSVRYPNYLIGNGRYDLNTRIYFRTFTNGNNITNLLLQKNGYKTGIAGHDSKVLFFDSKMYDILISGKENININNAVLKAIAKGSLNSVIQSSDKPNIDLNNFIIENAGENKIFAWAEGGPNHSSEDFTIPELELKKWMNPFKEAMLEMQIEMETIIKNNPNAIIIFMSDHGPFLIDEKPLPDNYDYSKVDYIKFRDLFGAFMAIRWPNAEKASKYDNDFNIVQDLFPIVFAYLFDSEIPLKYKIQNTELQLGPHKFDKGVFYRGFYENEFR